MQVTYSYEIRDADGENIAHARVKETPGGLWLTDVWCKAAHRRKGLATKLVTRVVQDWCNHDLFLSVEPYTDQPMGAPALQVFYLSFGFQFTGVPYVLHRPPSPWVGRS